MGSKSEDSATLLRRLFATAAIARNSEQPPSIQLLRRLLAVAPKTARPPRKPTLFEAINVLDLENPQSDFLAWLLDPLGPLTEMWLLKAMFDLIAPQEQWPGTPIVEREVVVQQGRADIVIGWDSFKLVIENKVWSTEGDRQVARYLEGFAIAKARDGRVVYLTPHGDRPASVGENDDRVAALSYRQLAQLIRQGLDSACEKSERGRIFATEFLEGLSRLLKVKVEMKKPEISEATKILLGNVKQFSELERRAMEESADLIEWMYAQMEQQIRSILGQGTIVISTSSKMKLFALPSWKRSDAVFGIGFGTDVDLRKRILGSGEELPWIGIAVCQCDGSQPRAFCKPFADELNAALRGVWPYPDDWNHSFDTWPLWRYLPLPEDGNLDQWADAAIKLLMEITVRLKDKISDYAKAK